MARRFHRLSGIGITLALSLSAWWSVTTISFHYENHIGISRIKMSEAMVIISERPSVSDNR
jgi:hypothetical protein